MPCCICHVAYAMLHMQVMGACVTDANIWWWIMASLIVGWLLDGMCNCCFPLRAFLLNPQLLLDMTQGKAPSGLRDQAILTYTCRVIGYGTAFAVLAYLFHQQVRQQITPPRLHYRLLTLCPTGPPADNA